MIPPARRRRSTMMMPMQGFTSRSHVAAQDSNDLLTI